VVFRQGDHKVHTLPPQRAQEPLTEGIGLGTPRRCFQDPETQVPHLLIELLGEDAVPVMDQEAVAVVSWDRFAQLLHRPVGCWVLGHMDMQDSAAGVFHHHKHIERLEGGCDHYAEITGDDRLGMIAHEGEPALRRDVLMPSVV
jgi:hypothetical protein